MSATRFSNQELYRLRNEIPVDILIEKALGIPSRFTEGYFRFLCPLCNEFNTAVNPQTNLSRCFRCEKNFNTIDLVMLVRKSDFVTSISFLKKYLKSNQIQIHPKEPTPKDHKQRLEHIGNVLGSIIPPSHAPGPNDSNKSIPERILSLEQQVQYLTSKIEKIGTP